MLIDTMPPILNNKVYRAPSAFTPENLLREARRQKSIPPGAVPRICVLDPDGDLLKMRKLPAKLSGLRDPASDKYIGSDENWRMAEEALRVLAIAWKPDAAKDSMEAEMMFLGLVGLMDPARPEARDAIRRHIGDIGVLGQVGRRAGHGLNRHVRHERFARLRQSRRDQADAEIVVDLPAEHVEHIRGLGRIDRAAASEADEHLRPCLPDLLRDTQEVLAR